MAAFLITICCPHSADLSKFVFVVVTGLGRLKQQIHQYHASRDAEFIVYDTITTLLIHSSDDFFLCESAR